MTATGAAGRRVGEIPARPGLRAVRERESITTFLSTVAVPPRAIRLHIEAGNCLDIAVAKQDVAATAELIDEAIRLAQRSRELMAGTDRRGKFR